MSPQDDILIRQILSDKLGIEHCELHKLADPGSSRSRVFLYKAADGLVAVKIASNPRVSQVNEAAGRGILAPHLGSNVADIYWSGDVNGKEVMIYQSIGTSTLHGEVVAGNIPEDDLLEIWTDVVDKLTDMWKNTSKLSDSSVARPREYSARHSRVRDGLLESVVDGLPEPLKRYSDHTLVINGEERGTLSGILAELADYTPPAYTVTCHGDPQPSNIVIDSKTSKWQLIDWEWSSPGHDWRMMAAHLYGWWLTRTCTIAQAPKVRTEGTKLYIDYKVPNLRGGELYQRVVADMLNQKFNLDASPEDKAVFLRFLALLLLGEGRFAHLWGREKLVPIFIGEAAKLVRLEKESMSRL